MRHAIQRDILDVLQRITQIYTLTNHICLDIYMGYTELQYLSKPGFIFTIHTEYQLLQGYLETQNTIYQEYTDNKTLGNYKTII